MIIAKERLHKILKWSEKYTKTDMIYLARSSFWLNLNNILGALLSFILTIFFAKYLSQDTFGIYKYILSMAGIATAFSLSGINPAVTRAVAQGFDGVFRKSIFIQLKWAIPQFLFTFILSIYYFYNGNNIYGLSFLITSLLAPISSIANTYNAFLNGKKDFKTSSMYGISSNLFYFVLILAITISAPSAVILIAGYYIANAGTNIFFCYRTFKKYKPSDNFRNEDIDYAKHISFINFFNVIAAQFDNIIVYHLLGPAQLAIFSFATVIPERIRTMFGFISTISLPKLAEKEKASGRESIRDKVWSLIFLSLFISLVYILVAPYIFHLFFPKYSSSILYSQVFSLSLIVISANILLSKIVAHRNQAQLYIHGITFPIIKIVITAILIYYYGIWGAVFSRIIANIINILLPAILINRAEKI